ncbi:hypothetical protein Tco_1554309, partial [Tanacetum coccineum]
MDIRDEIKASKVDKSTQSSLLSDSNLLPKSSLLPDSDQNNSLNKPQLSSGVKGIDCVSPIKSKYTCNSDSPRRRLITMSERDKLLQARKQKMPVKKPAAVVEKPDAVVGKVPKHKAPAKKLASVVVNDPTELDQEKDKEKHKASAKEPASIVGRASDVVNDSVVVEIVCDVVKASDALKNKSVVVSVIDLLRAKDNAPNPKDNKSKAHSDVVPVAEKPKPNPKQKEKSTVQELSEVPVLRSSNQKVNPDVKSKVVVRVSKSKETPVKRKRIVSKEDDRKKKLKGKSKKEDSDSELETDNEESVPKKGVPVGGYSLFGLDEREADHEFVKLWVGQFHPLELRDLRVNDIARKLVAAKEIDFLFKVNFLTLFTNTMGKADGLKGQICLDVVRRLRKDSVISDIDWCGYIYDCLRDSKLPSGTNHYLGPLTFLILLYLDSTKFDRFPVVRTRPAIRNWSTYLMKQRQESELKDRVLGLLDLHVEWTEAEVQEAEGFIGSLEISEKEDLIKKAEEKLSLICAERVMLEDYMRKASLKCPGDGKFVALHEKYVNLFKDPISFKDDGNGDNVGDDDDDENGDDDDGNVDEEDVNEGDKDPNGSNPSFGFSKISLEDFGNDRGPAEKDKVVEGNPTEQGTVVEGNQDEECEIMSTPENFTQWLDKNVDLVGEVIDSITAEYLYGDLFGDNSATLELMNQEITPEKLPTQKASP